jgi:hypothetical protein
MSKTLRILAVILVLAVFILSAVPASALAAYPDSVPTVERVKIFRNLLTTGDFYIIFEANIPYAVPPATTEPNTYIWRLIAVDGVTVLGSTTGFAYHDSGYNYNVYSMYFSTATAPAWGAIYKLRLSGNPTQFTTPLSYNYDLNASDYTTLVTTAENKAALANEVIYLAGELNTRWNMTLPADRLTTELEDRTVLSLSVGELVFRGITNGIQAMAPAAFAYSIVSVNSTDRTWNVTLNGALEGQWAGTWVETARNSSIDFFDLGYDLLGLFILLILCVILLVANLSVTGDPWNALVDVAFLLVIATRLGAFGVAYIALIAALCVIFIGTRIWRMIPQ